MSNQNLKFIITEGILEEAILEVLINAYIIVFENVNADLFIKRIQTKEDVISIIAYKGEEILGFKIGYKYDEITFYSWVGGVLPNYRRKGIAKKLAEIQEKRVREKGYVKIRTKSMNCYKPMILMNVKNGFDIVEVYTNEKEQRKIIFEKEI